MGKARVLVVEDEGVIRDYIKVTLQDLGYSVPAAVATGEDAVAKAEETRPDLVLMDIRLKGKLDGIEAARQIGSHLNIPVIYLTSYADENTLERAKTTRPFGYIVKPFDEKEVHATIEMAIYKDREEKQMKERLLQELQSTHQRIFGLARELTDQSGPVHLNAPPLNEIPSQAEPQQSEKTYTVKEAANYLGISDRTIQRMMKEGIFPEPSVTINIGGDRQIRRWNEEDLDAFKPHVRGKGRPKGHE